MSLVVGIDDNTAKVLLALIGVIPSSVVAVLTYKIRRDTKTPSGDAIGHVVERTHDIAHTNSALLMRINGQRDGDKDTPIPPTKEA